MKQTKREEDSGKKVAVQGEDYEDMIGKSN